MKRKTNTVRNISLTIVGILAVDLACYGIWSMTYWNLHPATWDALGRFLLGFVYFITLVAGVLGVIFDVIDEADGGKRPAKQSEYSRKGWSNMLPMIKLYAEGAAIEFNSGLAGSGVEDHWIEVGSRCSFDWPAHYYRRAEQAKAPSQLHPA